MMISNQIKLSVRQIVEFALKAGSLEDSFLSSNRAVLGTRAHQKLQKRRKQELGEHYIDEYCISQVVDRAGLSFLIEGRIDGIILSETDVIIEEIKSTYTPLELIERDYNELHWAQAKLYGYIYGLQNNLSHIHIQLAYYHLDQDECKLLIEGCSMLELQDYFYRLLDKLCAWYRLIQEHLEARNNSIAELQFPFESYRKNQRELAVAVYKTIAEGSSIFVQAPTGTGKTISTIFPAVKALGEGKVSKIFYLTAKTITRQVAEATIQLLATKQLLVKSIVITAKDKICFEPSSSCNSESCIYAKGYFDRVDEAVKELFVHENIINRAIIEEYAKKYSLCPYELSLDLSLWADIIICDYNYVFDPRAHLRRYFGDGSDNSGTDRQYALLVDEAHNLIDRSREMYSTAISKAAVLEQKRAFKKLNKSLYQALSEVNQYFITCKKTMPRGSHVTQELSKELCKLLRTLVAEYDLQLQNNSRMLNQDGLQLYFDILFFLKLSELFDEHFVSILENNKNMNSKIFCVDASQLLQDKLKKAKAAVYFSATLLPIQYYVHMLGGNENSYTMRMLSSFPRENLGLCVVKGVSTKFKDRESSLQQVAEYISSAVSHKRGNYLVYCSSYAYMKSIVEVFEAYARDFDVLVQSQDMDEESKEEFIQCFQVGKDKTMVAFAVMGGIFSEGIDLVGERLSGAVIVGVGLPQLCLERDIIKAYFDREKGTGFDYAYKFPGMNKVQQAAGRVIRTEQDRGIVVLIDDRFDQSSYNRLFPKEWEQHAVLRNAKELNQYVADFWIDKNEGGF